MGFEGGLFFNKIDEFLLAEKLFALTWKSALIVTSVGRGITLSVNVNRGHDSRYKSNRTLIHQEIKETVLFGNLFTFLCFNSVFGSKIPLNIFSFFYLMLHVNLLICCMIFSVVTLCMNV